MNLVEALSLPELEALRSVTALPVTVSDALDREVRWVSSIDLPEPFEWIREGTLLLSTGYAWPRNEDGLREYVRRIVETGAVGLVLAVPKYFDAFPEAARQEAQKRGLPAFEIPWELPFHPIIEVLHRHILNEQSVLMARSEAIHRTLTEAALEAGSLQDLARTLSLLIGRSVWFENLEGSVLAHAPQGLAPAGLGLVRLERMGQAQRLKSGRGAVHLMPVERSIGLRTGGSGTGGSGTGGSRLACPIRIGGEWVGTVWLEEGELPFSDLDARAAEHAAVVSALYLTHQRALSVQEARLGYAFVDALLEGQFEPTPHALERSRLLGFDPNGRYRVALLRLEAQTPLSNEDFARREQLLEGLKRRLEDLKIAALFSVTLALIPLVLPEDSGGKPLPLERLWQELTERFPHPLSLAVARVETGWQGVGRSYREALSLLKHVPAGQMRTHAELLLPRVLAGDSAAQSDFLEQLFGPLRLERGGEALIQTLLALTRGGFHLKKTALELGVHLNTLRYRLDRVRDLSGLTLEDSETRFRLQLAQKLLELQGE